MGGSGSGGVTPRRLHLGGAGRRIGLPQLVRLMADNPRRIFGLAGGLNPGDRADVAVVDFDREFKVDSADFISMGKATPFDGLTLRGKVLLTIVAGKVVYEETAEA